MGGMFPGAGAEVYYNEAGEPLGWDAPSEPGDNYCDSCGGSHHSIACPMDDDLEYDDDEYDNE